MSQNDQNLDQNIEFEQNNKQESAEQPQNVHQNGTLKTQDQSDTIKECASNRIYEKVLPNPGQKQGKDLIYSDAAHKLIVEAVKIGDENRLRAELQRQGVEARNIVDFAQFQQNLLFSAVLINDQEVAIKMITLLLKLGVDSDQKDLLQQTPLYYASRDGKCKLIKFLIDQGLRVNDIDTYGQNPIYYAVNLGHLDACKVLVDNGSMHDYVDENGETPLFYAIKSNRASIVEYLISLGCNLQVMNSRGANLVSFATRQNRSHFKDILIAAGAPVPVDSKSQKKVGGSLDKSQEQMSSGKKSRPGINPINNQQVQALKPIRENELEKDKEFALQILDGDQLRQISLEEFEKFAREHPDLAKYFFEESEIENIQVPKIDESAQIFYHWEKACTRLIQTLMRNPAAWIFNEPVNPEKLQIFDYFDIIKKPMDFSTIRERLKRHDYRRAEEFIYDVNLVFNNCIKYNGKESRAGIMCKQVQEEYKNLYSSLNFQFYITEEGFDEDGAENQELY